MSKLGLKLLIAWLNHKIKIFLLDTNSDTNYNGNRYLNGKIGNFNRKVILNKLKIIFARRLRFVKNNRGFNNIASKETD